MTASAIAVIPAWLPSLPVARAATTSSCATLSGEYQQLIGVRNAIGARLEAINKLLQQLEAQATAATSPQQTAALEQQIGSEQTTANSLQQNLSSDNAQIFQIQTQRISNGCVVPAPPTVTAVNPNTGPQAGGTPVTITGNSFTGATAVHFGTAAATNITVTSDTQMTATSPAGTGTVDVTVTNPGGTSTTSIADQFAYTAATGVLAYLGQFGSHGSGDGQFAEPIGVAVDAGTHDVYVVDNANYRVEKFDGAGNYLSQFGTNGSGGGQFRDPVAVAIDPGTHDVYVTDSFNSSTEHVDRVEKFDSNGKYLTQFGSYGSGDGQFNQDWGVAVDPGTHDVYVANTSGSNPRVEKFDPNGSYLSQIGYGSCGTPPEWVAVDSTTRDVYVTGPYPCVEKFDALGTPILSFGSSGSGDGQFASPMGLTVDPGTDDVYVVDEGNARVQQFDGAGNYLSQFGSRGTGEGQFVEPLGLALDPGTHNVYVTDAYNARVEII